MGKENLFLCMGSACHQLGVYDVLPKLQQLIARHKLEEAIELKGSFCLENCSHGIVIKFQDVVFIHIDANNLEERFACEILPQIQQVLV